MKDRLFNVQRHERRKFPRHFLNSVHCELGFNNFARAELFEHESHLTESLGSLGFVQSGSIHERELHFRTEDGSPHVTEAPSEHVGIQYKLDHPRQRIRLTVDSIVFSDFSYDGFDQFHEQLASIIEALQAAYGVLDLRKLGLRKINSLFAEPVESYVDACVIFNPDIFGMLRSGIAESGTLKSSEENLIVEKEHSLARLKLQFNRKEHPNKYEARLDYDLVNREKRRTDECGEILRQMNQEHFDLFMWTITDEMIELMKDTSDE